MRGGTPLTPTSYTLIPREQQTPAGKFTSHHPVLSLSRESCSCMVPPRCNNRCTEIPMIMQRFTRLTAHRQTASHTVNRHTTSVVRISNHNQGWQWKKWSAALLCAVVVTAGASSAPASKNGESLALQGHAKRYMRINEYLFHGTQKTTAIA